MSFNPEHHYIDDKGFQRHKETHHLVGIEDAPPEKHPDEGAEFPKWVVPHPNHIERHRDHVSTPRFPHYHVNRNDGKVTVLVHDLVEEALAAADPHAKPAD